VWTGEKARQLGVQVLHLVAGEIEFYSNGTAKIVVAIIIIMALWGQKNGRGGK
jgi:hypothetical protein